MGMLAVKKVEGMLATDSEPTYSEYYFMAYLVLGTVGGRHIFTSSVLLSSMFMVPTSEGTITTLLEELASPQVGVFRF